MALYRTNKRARPVIQTSVTLSPEFYELSRKHKIAFSEAMKVGISILLAEKGVKEYDNRLNIFRMLEESKIKAMKYAEKAFELEERLKELEGKNE